MSHDAFVCNYGLSRGVSPQLVRQRDLHARGVCIDCRTDNPEGTWSCRSCRAKREARRKRQRVEQRRTLAA